MTKHGTLARVGGNRCRVSFQLTFLETNVNELSDIIKLAAELGVDRVKGHHVWTHFKEIEGLSMRRSPQAIARWNLAVDKAHHAARQSLLPNGKQVLLENIFPLDEQSPEDLAPGEVCPFLGQEAWVSAEGRFDPCCAPDEMRRTLGDFGNLNEVSIRDVWDSPEYRILATTYRNRSLCIGCNMRRPGRGE